MCFSFSFCLCVCALWSELWFEVEFVGLADEMATEGRHCGMRLWGQGLRADDLHFSEGAKPQFKGAKVIVFHLSHSIPTLKTSLTIFYFSFYSFHRKWHLLSILGPVAQIYVDVSNENSTTSPNICRTAVRPFSLFLLHLSLSHFLILYPLFLLYFVFLLIYFSKAPAWDDAAFTHDVKCCFCRDY